MLSEKLGHVFDEPLKGLAKRINLSPNTITFTGFLLIVVSSVVLISDLRAGGIIVVAGSLFDVLDGVVARVNKKTSRFGAFLDSVLDRYSDSLIFLAIAYNLSNKQNYIGAMLSIGILTGAFLISYTRARAEGLGEQCKHGLMERPERIILISIGTITGYIMPVLWLMLFLTHFTALQRIFYVRNILQERIEDSSDSI